MGDWAPVKKEPVSFVIRLWLEPREASAQPEWRWHVRHIQSGTEAYFRDMSAMLRFIADQSEVPPPHQSSL